MENRSILSDFCDNIRFVLKNVCSCCSMIIERSPLTF